MSNVEHPDHYNQNSLETLDVIKGTMSSEQFEGFLVGNILKYISRYKFKNGAEDLKKARFYLDKLIAVTEVKKHSGNKSTEKLK